LALPPLTGELIVILETPGYVLLRSEVEEFIVLNCAAVNNLTLGNEEFQVRNVPTFFIKM
jgi:thiamine pyrophosphokinase